MAAAQLSPTGRAGLGAATPRRDVDRVRAALRRTPRRPGVRRLRSLLRIAAQSLRRSRAA
jgi:hypothetical protein